MKFLIFLSMLFAFGCGSSGGSSYGGGGGNNGGSGTPVTPGVTTFDVSIPNAPNSYTINGSENPTLTLQRGQTYTFNVNSPAHPFFIMSVQGTNTANAYTTGISGNGAQTGTVIFTVPAGAPNTLYYDCSIHSAMTGVITVTN